MRFWYVYTNFPWFLDNACKNDKSMPIPLEDDIFS